MMKISDLFSDKIDISKYLFKLYIDKNIYHQACYVYDKGIYLFPINCKVKESWSERFIERKYDSEERFKVTEAELKYLIGITNNPEVFLYEDIMP